MGSLQNILPYLVPIMIVVFSVGARAVKWANEKQAERQMIQQRERARAEALRTGKPIADPGTVDVSVKEMASANQATGQARLEALRQQRIEQLRKIREQRTGRPASPQQTSAQSLGRPAPSTPIARPAPGRTPAAQARSAQPDPRRTVLNASQRRQENAQRMALEERRRQLEQARRRAEEAQRAAEKPKPQRPKAAEGQSRLSSLRVNPELSAHVGKLHADHADQPIESSFGVLSASSSSKQMRAVLGNRAALRHAIIVNELLGKPVALRTDPSDF